MDVGLINQGQVESIMNGGNLLEESTKIRILLQLLAVCEVVPRLAKEKAAVGAVRKHCVHVA